MTDFSKPETKQLFALEVAKRIALGMTREQAEMLVAALMWEPENKTGGMTTLPHKEGHDAD